MKSQIFVFKYLHESFGFRETAHLSSQLIIFETETRKFSQNVFKHKRTKVGKIKKSSLYWFHSKNKIMEIDHLLMSILQFKKFPDKVLSQKASSKALFYSKIHHSLSRHFTLNLDQKSFSIAITINFSL